MLPVQQMQFCMNVIELIRQGRTKSSACRIVGISVTAFNNACKRIEELATLHDEAMSQSYDMMAEALLEPDSHEVYGSVDPKMAKVISDNIKWLLARRDNKRYGDKVQVDVSLTADQAIIEALNAAKGRVPQLEAPAQDVEDAEIVPDYLVELESLM